MSNSEKTKSKGGIFPFLMMAALLVIVDILALLVTQSFQEYGVIAFENPTDPLDLVYFFVSLIAITVLILLFARFRMGQLVLAIVLGSVAFLVFYVVYAFLSVSFSELWSLSVSVVAAALLVILLVKYPEWYVIDACGILVGLATTAMLGISLSVFLVIILLAAMATYDVISVYRTKHMIDLADVVLDLRLPVMLVIPKSLNYSMLTKKKGLKQQIKDQEEREASFMGLGDIVMPGALVVSTFSNLPSNGLLVAISVMIGSLFGFALMTINLAKGNPQPGLPYLCSGAILGYLVSSLLLFGGLAGLGF
jgi:presenilin-like A22 family membrane protease